MQIVINIPEDIYESRDDEDYIRMCAKEISKAFRNGTVLEPHGRLIDADNISYEDMECDGCSDMGMVLDIIDKYIEAESEE